MLPVPSLPHIKLSLFLNAPILLAALVAFLVFYLIVSSVLVYHWHAYGMKSWGIKVAELLFFVVSVFLFTLAVVSLSYF